MPRMTRATAIAKIMPFSGGVNAWGDPTHRAELFVDSLAALGVLELAPDAMDAVTLDALRASIAKWRGIVLGTERDEGHHNCALCATFLNRDDARPGGMCAGCPVMLRTGVARCDGSPYETAWVKHAGALTSGFAVTDAARAAAQDEVDFLRSLLPQDDPDWTTWPRVDRAKKEPGLWPPLEARGRSGWHWVCDDIGAKRPRYWRSRGSGGCWKNELGHEYAPDFYLSPTWTYVGPCVPPDEEKTR